MMKALIGTNQNVAQIVPDGEEFPVHPDLAWVPCGPEITDRHTWNGTGFDEPVNESLED